MNFFFIVLVVILVMIGLFFFFSSDHYLKTGPASAAEVQGKFTLLLYGCASPDQLENVAILDREDDQYSFEIHAPAFAFTSRAGLTAAEALREAEQFVRCNIKSEGTALRKVLGPDHARAIGFEVRPLYPVAAFGKHDVLAVRYLIKGRTISVHIELDPALELQRTN